LKLLIPIEPLEEVIAQYLKTFHPQISFHLVRLHRQKTYELCLCNTQTGVEICLVLKQKNSEEILELIEEAIKRLEVNRGSINNPSSRWFFIEGKEWKI